MDHVADFERFLSAIDRTSGRFLVDHHRATRTGFSQLVGLATDWEDRFARLGLAPGTPIIIPMRLEATSIAILFGAIRHGLFPVLIKASLPMNLAHETMLRAGRGIAVAGQATKGLLEAYGYLEIGCIDQNIHLMGAGASVMVSPPKGVGLIGIQSSGSTGYPKIIVHKVSNLIRNASMHVQALHLDDDDVVALTLPLNFSYGLVAGLLGTLLAGCTAIIADPHRVNIKRALTQYSVTIGMSTPSNVLANFDQELLGRIRRLTIGGDVLHSGLAKTLLNLMPQGLLIATYGLTEAGPRVATQVVDKECLDHFQAVPLGKPLDCVVLSTGDEDDGSGFSELYVHTPTAMIGYLGDEDGTRAALDSRSGQIRTGDMFYQRDGELLFASRRKRIIVRDGESIYPGLIESAILRLTNVDDVWVSAESDDKVGQVPVARLVTRQSIDVHSLARSLRRMVPTSHIPVRWEVVEALPSGARK